MGGDVEYRLNKTRDSWSISLFEEDKQLSSGRREELEKALTRHRWTEISSDDEAGLVEVADYLQRVREALGLEFGRREELLAPFSQTRPFNIAIWTMGSGEDGVLVASQRSHDKEESENILILAWHAQHGHPVEL